MASLRDGLGGEELTPSGIEASGAVLVHPYFAGSVTSMDSFSGANVYSTTNVIGENVYGDTVVSGALMKATTISGTNIVNSQGVLKSVLVGSGTAYNYGAFIQAGSGVLASNKVWVVYPVAYAGKPTIVCTSAVSGINPAIWVFTGSITAGSFCAVGSDPAGNFNWLSVGI